MVQPKTSSTPLLCFVALSGPGMITPVLNLHKDNRLSYKMNTVDPDNIIIAEQENTPAPPRVRHDPPRGFLAEWTVTIILLLFGTTALVQAYVIPTGSMENTLLVGDHLLVDKLAYSP